MSISRKIYTQNGFTLLEVLIAIAIFAVISLASFSIFNTVIKSEERSSERIAEMNEIQRAFMIMERDFLQISKRTVRIEGDDPLEGFIHADSSAFESTSGSIAFVRSGWTNPGLLLPRSNMQSVAYRLNDNILERIHYNFVDADLSEKAKIRKLISSVNEISFEFHDGKQWNKTFEGEDLPLAISVVIDTEQFGVITRKYLVAGTMP